MTMIVRFHETGGPDVLRLENVELSAAGPDELRLRVGAIGLNRGEASFRMGEFREEAKLPSKIGCEASGIVEDVGEGVDGFGIGDIVATVPGFSQGRYGVYGEAAIVPACMVAPYPGSLSFEQGASIWMAYLTAWGALVHDADIGPGDTVLIPAASSSVGLAAIQVAKSMGATPVALTRTSAKRAALEKAAPGTCVIFTEEQDLLAEVMRLTDGNGARVAFDPVGGPAVAALTGALAPGGKLLLYGMLSSEPAPLPIRALMRKRLTVRGFQMVHITQEPATFARAKAFVFDGLESGILRPVIARTFALTEITEAHRYLESGAQVGKIVVRP
jgi:NADPH:quinone reductase-like Zn-dependent oxidoreductase